MSDQIPTHPGPGPGPFAVTDDASSDRHQRSLDKLKVLRTAVQQRVKQLDDANFAIFLERTPEVREEYATEALDEMFDWYEDYVEHRATMAHYLDALAVVEEWAADPTKAPEPLPELVLEGVGEEAPTAPGLVHPILPVRPVRPIRPVRPLDRQQAFGATVADTQQLRADLHREVAEVMPKVLASELDARLPILLNEQLRGLGATGAFTPIGGKYTPDTPAQAPPREEEQLVGAGVKAGAIADVAPARAEPHPAPRRHRR